MSVEKLRHVTLQMTPIPVTGKLSFTGRGGSKGGSSPPAKILPLCGPQMHKGACQMQTPKPPLFTGWYLHGQSVYKITSDKLHV